MADLKSRFAGRIETGGGISISMDPPAARLASKVEAWAELIEDNGPFFADAEELIANHGRRHFDTEGAATGPRWKPLVDWYREWKEEQRPGRPILVFNGRLRAAVVDRRDGYKSKIGKKSATFGIDPSFTTPEGVKLIDYARGHNSGVPARRLPKRPVYRWNPTINKGSAGGTMTLGTALSQLRQAHVVAARRTALGADERALTGTTAADRSSARIETIKRRKTK